MRNRNCVGQRPTGTVRSAAAPLCTRTPRSSLLTFQPSLRFRTHTELSSRPQSNQRRSSLPSSEVLERWKETFIEHKIMESKLLETWQHGRPYPPHTGLSSDLKRTRGAGPYTFITRGCWKDDKKLWKVLVSGTPEKLLQKVVRGTKNVSHKLKHYSFDYYLFYLL